VSTEVAPKRRLEPTDQVDKRIELVRRFTLTGFQNPGIFEDIPKGVLMYLLPDDDPEFVEREIVAGAAASRRGENVYLKHVRVSDLVK